MKALRGLSVFAALTLSVDVCAAVIETVKVPSAAMGRDIPVTVMLPDAYGRDSGMRYPVVYMLHGAGDNHTTFADEVGRKGVDEGEFIGVCPDGERKSWWYDSPVNPKWKYETFVAKELVAWIDSRYRTRASKEGRAITGGSMGGHGACWLGFRHRNVFGAIGNIYGGVDVRRHRNSWKVWGLLDCLGDYGADKETWDRHMCVTEAAKLRNRDVNLLTVVGTGDFFLEDNRQLHRILTENKVAHLHLEIRGEDDSHSCHTHPFRKMAAAVVFRYFRNYFTTGRAGLE
ncbi:MAG: prolyl oligopeptidase family serine peptidase [Kiritimatiellae bacterium]|nr:prolyl oligopeptidase family serine peptidase [Kiritimatiellia bacterium]